MKKKEDDYIKYTVPNQGNKLPDGTYWNFISQTEAEEIKKQGMKAENGRECLEIRNVSDRIIARWQS